MSDVRESLGKLFSRLREPYRAIASAALVVDGRVLMVREKSGGWNLPGGRLRPGESPTRAAVREAKEETGLKVTLDSISGVYRYVSRTGRPRVRYVFWAAMGSGQLSWDGKEILEARWVPVAEAVAMKDADLEKPALLRRILGDVAAGRRMSMENLEQVTPTSIAA